VASIPPANERRVRALRVRMRVGSAFGSPRELQWAVSRLAARRRAPRAFCRARPDRAPALALRGGLRAQNQQRPRGGAAVGARRQVPVGPDKCSCAALQAIRMGCARPGARLPVAR
jgi:hypothetical protein